MISLLLDDVTNEDILFLKEVFYDSFKNSLNKMNKTKNLKDTDSSFIYLLNKDPTPVQKIIEENSISIASFPSSSIQSLLSKKLIVLSFNQKDYVISPLGIWLVETRLEILSEINIIDYLQNKFFNSGITEKLNPKEKVALLSLISIGAFYEETPLDRKNGSFSSSQLSRILVESKDFLNSEGVISDKDLKLNNDSEDEIVDSVFRRLNDLAKKTGHLYRFGEKKSWLSLYDESTRGFDSESLSFLLWKIFGENIDLEQQKRIDKFCQKISIDYLYEVFNEKQISMHLFHIGGYENSISDSLFDILRLSDNWE